MKNGRLSVLTQVLAERVTDKRKISTDETGHIPVMADAVLNSLAPRDGESFVDGTFGGGGYAEAILKSANCKVWGIDRDPTAVSRGADLAKVYVDRLHVLEGRFSEMEALLSERGITGIDGVTLDLGVSSFQLNDSDRGFSFQSDGPLDMRMGASGRSAGEVVNEEDELDLRNLIRTYGEERHAGRIARAIVFERSREPVRTTRRLADIVVHAMPKVSRRRHHEIHPATRTFQALRIYVNDEIGELKRGLVAAERLLNPRGRLAVVSFHSLEDREVKQFLRSRSGFRPKTSRHNPPTPEDTAQPTFDLLFRGVRRPSESEISHNSRARSARLRAGVRTLAPLCPAKVSA